MFAAGDISGFFHDEFSDLADSSTWMRITVRLFAATALGAVLGGERERAGKPAGFRTHMIVALAGASFVLIPLMAGYDSEAVSRVIQGVLAGIGFIGGGSILKLSDKEEVRGLTTAAEIWLSTAIGMAAGLGRYGLALCSTIIAFIVVTYLRRLEQPKAELNKL